MIALNIMIDFIKLDLSPEIKILIGIKNNNKLKIILEL